MSKLNLSFLSCFWSWHFVAAIEILTEISEVKKVVLVVEAGGCGPSRAREGLLASVAPGEVTA